eukprot:10446758-Ditylum_brightwellii.AAC.1
MFPHDPLFDSYVDSSEEPVESCVRRLLSSPTSVRVSFDKLRALSSSDSNRSAAPSKLSLFLVLPGIDLDATASPSLSADQIRAAAPPLNDCRHIDKSPLLSKPKEWGGIGTQ